MKYLALVLAEEKKQYAVRLETLALKKSQRTVRSYFCLTSSKPGGGGLPYETDGDARRKF